MADSSLNVTRDAGAGVAPAVRNEFTRVVEEKGRVGRLGLVGARSRQLYRYDRHQGAATATMQGGSDQADRMPVEDAAALLHTLHVQFGVDKQMEGFIWDFDFYMFICYALNGGSQFTPSSRVKFYVGSPDGEGTRSAFSLLTVYTILGTDLRRFFRTFADDIVDTCKTLINHCDFNNAHMVDLRDEMLALAQKRNISRYPYLLADCVDAAIKIDSSERHAALRSKAYVIAMTTNAVDKRTSAFAIRSADNYDSSVGASVDNSNDIHSGTMYHD